MKITWEPTNNNIPLWVIGFLLPGLNIEIVELLSTEQAIAGQVAYIENCHQSIPVKAFCKIILFQQMLNWSPTENELQ